MELKQLDYFVKCAKSGSFSKAARELFTTQSSVSKTIKALETELGVKLFERHARGIRLTEEGCQIYQHTLQIYGHLQEITKIGKEIS